MAKAEHTLIASGTIAANESTMANFSSDSVTTEISAMRGTQFILKVAATFNAATDGGLVVFLYPSADNTTYDDKYWYRWHIPHSVQVGYDSGSSEFVMGETITAAGGGTATVIGWTVTSGAWGDSDAAGVVYFEDKTGTMSDNGAFAGSVSGATMAYQDGSIAAHTIQRHSKAISPVAAYYKGMMMNEGNQSITNAALKATEWSL